MAQAGTSWSRRPDCGPAGWGRRGSLQQLARQVAEVLGHHVELPGEAGVAIVLAGILERGPHIGGPEAEAAAARRSLGWAATLMIAAGAQPMISAARAKQRGSGL